MDDFNETKWLHTRNPLRNNKLHEIFTLENIPIITQNDVHIRTWRYFFQFLTFKIFKMRRNLQNKKRVCLQTC